MTATDDAPDTRDQRDRWNQLARRLDDLRAHVQAETDHALASLDAHAARLAALRRQIAGQWPPSGPRLPGP
ncbi:hypothetical protein GCM10020229_71980 [Kitasatospora albolonga]